MLARSLLNQVVAFLSNQSRNDRDDRTLRFFRQAKSTQQIEFAFRFPDKIVGREVRGDMRISFRIPDFVVDAVGDSSQPIAARTQQPVEPVTLFRSLNLPRITRTYRRERIGGNQSRLSKPKPRPGA